MKKTIIYALGLAFMHGLLVAQVSTLVLNPQNLPKTTIHQCIPADFRAFLSNPTEIDRAFTPAGDRDFPSMGWPLGKPLYDDLFMMNYFDESNPGTVDNQFTDYECDHNLGYDGHTGTDITVFNFRLMDKGMPIFATADGIVAAATWDIYDRNYGPPYPTTTANIVRILHDDGTQSVFVHLRKNSIAVNVGEEVTKGQFLGFVGSSGWTPIPHLHIEFWGEGSIGFGNATYRDPWEGTCNMEASLWEEQASHVPENDIWIMDMGITTVDAVGGNLNTLTEIPFKNRAEEPIIYGSEDESILLAWIQLQAPVGSNYKIDIHHPNGNLIQTSGLQFISNYIRYWWHPYAWELTGFEASDLGTWIMKVFTNGELLAEHPFEIGEHTYFKPRFYPLNGKSFRMDGEIQKDTLQMWDLSTITPTFNLINAPAYVSLDDNIISVSTTNDGAYRSTEFQVVATGDLGYTDTMWYHIIDPNKEIHTTTALQTVEKSPDFKITNILPVPANGMVQVNYVLQETQEITMSLLNLNGQKIKSFFEQKQVSSGAHSLSFDTEVLGLVAGVYFIQMQGRIQQSIQKIVVLAH